MKKYTTATAFRAGLEERLRKISKKSGEDLQRLRRKVAFDRLLCRLFNNHPGDLFLKGGYSMELRLNLARTTKDIDLVLRVGTAKDRETQDGILGTLQKSARESLHDFFDFRIEAATADLEAVPYGGYRFPVEAHLDGRLFARFPMDIVVSSLVLEPIEEIKGQDWLQFAGIETMAFPVIPAEQQFAEKLHAYTFTRMGSENSRVKDLVDMALLIESVGLKEVALRSAIRKIFAYRNTHPLPEGLMEPPVTWMEPFGRLKRETGLSDNMDQALGRIARRLNLPIFSREEKILSVPTMETEVVREIYAAINRNDIPAALNFFDPQIERIEPAGFPASGVYRGHAEVEAHWSQARGTWVEGSCEPERCVVAGDKVIALVHVRVRLKNKTEWIEGRVADVFTFRDGKVIQMRTFAERREAFAWAGVE